MAGVQQTPGTSLEMLKLKGVSKAFTLHNQGQRTIPVLNDVDFDLRSGECMALMGSSGSGKSTLMRMVYGNYGCAAGEILIREEDGTFTDLAKADPREVIRLRRHRVGYVSQFLRVIPRVPAIDVVAEPMRLAGASDTESRDRAKEMLARLNLPETLWDLSPTTFSGGEQQRVNIARGFVHDYPILLLDEPTASLDKKNRQVVLDLILTAREKGIAILGIFHDHEAREAVCNRFFDVEDCRAAA